MSYYCKTWAYELERREDIELGIPRRVDPAPTQRRIQALVALGWSVTDIAARLGITQQAMSKVLRRDTWIQRATADRVARIYRELEGIEPGDTPWTRRNKARALRAGWPPPSGWLDIETGERATTGIPRNRLEVEEVDYLLDGHWHHPLSVREKHEALIRWLRTGRSEAALCRLTGWRAGRYGIYDEVPTHHQEEPCPTR